MEDIPEELKYQQHQLYKVCNNYEEMQLALLIAIKNGRNIFLYSDKPVGKTMLINDTYDTLTLNNYEIIGQEPEIEFCMNNLGYINVVNYVCDSNKGLWSESKIKVEERFINLGKKRVIIETNEVPIKKMGFFQRNFIFIYAKFEVPVKGDIALIA